MKRFSLCSVLVILFGYAALSANIECCPNPCWNSVYVGFNGGWGWSHASYDATPFGTTAIDDFTPQSVRNQINGPLFGGQVGFNKQVRCSVLGIEGDFDGAGINGYKSTIFPGFLPPTLAMSTNASSVYADLQWLATIRGRLGMVWRSSLIYVTGGAAWTHLKGKTLDVAETAVEVYGQATSGNFSKTKTGWVVGAGYERMIASRWSVRAEYLHYQFGSGPTKKVIFPNAASPNNGLNVSIGKSHVDAFRLGLNYLFKL